MRQFTRRNRQPEDSRVREIGLESLHYWTLVMSRVCYPRKRRYYSRIPVVNERPADVPYFKSLEKYDIFPVMFVRKNITKYDSVVLLGCDAV
jgi:hypothetical protein